LIEVCDTRDATTIDILLRDPQFRIALKTDPVIPGIPPDPLIKVDFPHPSACEN